MKFYFVLSLLLLYYATLKVAHAVEGDLTITVESGREECFFQPVAKDETIEIEFQVIDGDRDDMHIDFRLYDHNLQELVSAIQQRDGSERHKALVTGDVKICFENYGGARKTVYFEMFVDVLTEGSEDEDPDWAEDVTGAIPEENYEIAVQDIQDTINRVRLHLSKIQSHQQQIRSTEARDRNLQENNFTYVNNWSMFQLTIMMVVGLIQVITVRSLFDEKSRLHKLWKKF